MRAEGIEESTARIWSQEDTQKDKGEGTKTTTTDGQQAPAQGVESKGSKLSAIIAELGPEFAARAAEHDAEGSFVAENYQAMRERKLFSAAIPVEFGGGGASHGFDGWPNVGEVNVAGGIRSPSIEVTEERVPFFIRCHELRAESGGAGTWRKEATRLRRYYRD